MKSKRSLVSSPVLLLIVFFISACSGRDAAIDTPTSRPSPLQATPALSPIPTIVPISNTSGSRAIALARYEFGAIVTGAFSPEGGIFAVRGEDGTVILWNGSTDTQEFTFPGLSASLGPVAFSQDGRKLVSADGQGNIMVWDVSSREQIQTLKADFPSWIALSPDAQKLISFGESYLTIWNVSTGERIRTLQCVKYCGTVVFSPDGRFFAVSTFENDLKSTIVLRDSETGERIFTFQGEHISQVFSMSFSPDGKLLASGDRWDFIRIWNVEDGELLDTFNSRYNDPTGGGPSDVTRGIDVEGGVDALAFSPDGGILASGHNDGPIVLWDVSTTQPIHILRDDSYKQYFARHFMSLSFSPDGSILKSGRRNSPIIYWGLEENLTRYTPPLFP